MTDSSVLRYFVAQNTPLNMHMDIEIPRNISEFFTAHYGPQVLFFFLSFLVSMLLGPTGNAISGSSNVKQLPLVVLY